MRTLRLALAGKVAICVIAGTAAFFTLFGYINLRMERSYSELLVRQSAESVSDLILRSTRYDMLHNNRDALRNIIEDVGSQPGIRRIRIYNHEGRITLSTDGKEVGSTVDRSGAASRVFAGPRGGRVLASVRPIDNSADCSSASCHVHPASQRVLGTIHADLSLAAVDEQMAGHQTALRWFLAGAIAFGCASALLFTWIVVYRPVRELIDGTHRVAEGDLGYRLPVRSEDELGELAAAFNKMTAKVAGAQAHIEEQVRRKTAELERVHRTLLASEKMASIGKLAATVAHEINNPLFGILTYARLTARELSKHEFAGREDMTAQIGIIERESKRCGDLVKSLLTFSRQTRGHRESNDVNVIAGRAIVLVKHKLDMQSIDLEQTLGADLPPVDCDANQIEQVMLALLVNAAEAMPDGGRITFSTVFDDATAHNVICVKDTGCGIPPDILTQVFDPFFTTKEDQNRTGLGLAVAHNIVEQHGGEIHVRSTPGEGTEFTVRLPAVLVAAPAGASA